MGNINTVGPNEALIVSGGCCRSTKKTYVVGGWAWAWYLLSNVQRISLEIMTLMPKCENVETSEGVQLTVSGVAQCKIKNEKEQLSIACEQFLGKNVDYIKSILQQTLEGNLRSILGTMTVEEIYRERDQFASLVREVASSELERMGIEILSFTIKDVYDNVSYLESLGKAKIAEIKRNAAIGVANAERDAGIREAECQKAAMDVKYAADTKIEDATRAYLTQKAAFDAEVNALKAKAKLAYDLRSTHLQQEISFQQKNLELIERQKLTRLQEKEIELAENELKANVKLLADAQLYEIAQLTEGKKQQIISAAEADSERIELLGVAEANASEIRGRAETQGMILKAASMKQFGDAAILSLTLEHLPKIAAEISAPLSKTDEIVLLNGDTGNLSKVISQIPPTIHALTGVDLSKVLSKVPGAK
ncbi:Flotillin-2 [Sarcoptes scabiei]|uniref:Flotillin-2 n=1 Tax=Sarcoptes scabiei TaxID=52283 RepID=A0A834VD67_SARSC|nr:Flotillin-2 [Sarcoptes scabiei]